MVETEFYDAQEDMLTYDINVFIDMLQAHVHQQKPTTQTTQNFASCDIPKVIKGKWFKLSPEAHEIWDQLDDLSKYHSGTPGNHLQTRQGRSTCTRSVPMIIL